MTNAPEDLIAWFAGRLPDGWFTKTPTITSDSEEILIVGELAEPELGEGTTDEARRQARAARIDRFREETREQRMKVASEAERKFGRKVAWGAGCGDVTKHFTTLSIPVMTRLRMPERTVLDTLVDSGVARSRSEALAWCVRLVGKHQTDWLKDLREALVKVDEVRAKGPA